MRIDLDGIAERIEVLPLPRGNYRSLAVNEASIFYLNKDDDWDPSWGGETLDRRAVAKAIRPLLQRSSEGYPEQVMLCGTLRLEVTAGEGKIPYMADGEYYSETGSLVVTAGPPVEVVRLDRIDQES